MLTSGAILFFVWAFAATLPLPQQRPAFKAATELVEVDAVVLDRSGRPVSGLSKEDFEIREDGRRVTIVAFVPMLGARERVVGSDTAPAPPDSGSRFVVLLLDDAFVSPIRTTKIREIAREFIERMNGSDQLAVVRLNGDHTTTTTSREVALAALRQYGPERPLPPTTREEWYARVDSAMDTVADVARQLSRVRHRRKALVFIGAAALFVPTVPGPPAEYSASWFGALRELARANVSLYYLDPHGLVHEGPSIADATAPSPSANLGGGVSEAFDHGITFATESGGAAFVNSNYFDRAIEQVWRETGDYYLLGYEPARSDQALHTITVKVHRRGVQVRARKTR